jgi:hypothetical protein
VVAAIHEQIGNGHKKRESKEVEKKKVSESKEKNAPMHEVLEDLLNPEYKTVSPNKNSN